MEAEAVNWCVKDDNSQRFRGTVIHWLREHSDYKRSTYQFKDTPQNRPTPLYYGINREGQVRMSEEPWGKVLTIEGFIGNSLQQLKDKFNTSQDVTQVQSNEKEQPKGHIVKVQRITGTITSGQRPTGSTVPGRRSSTTARIGHLSYQIISVNGTTRSSGTKGDLPF